MNTPDFSYLTQYKPTDLTMILTSFFIGVIIASIAVLFHKLVLGGIVRKIIEKEALSPEKALSMQELGYSKNNLLIKFALRKGSTFRKIVLATAEENPRYFIPEERRIREELRFSKKGNGVLGLLVAIIIFAVICFAMLTVVPWFTNLIKTMF